jgi:uncharacterized membrane protein YjgN (DUF898 family)
MATMSESTPGMATQEPDQYAVRAGHDGDLGDLLALSLGVLLLKIVTFGIYHFWGRTRIRRYLWSHTSWENERLLYTGTGLELLLGYGRAFLLLVLPFYALSFAVGWIGQRHPLANALGGIAIALLVLYLTGTAVYASWRYRLSRTVWRGIRFGLTVSPWRYGWIFFGRTLLAIVTAGFYTPYMQCRMTERLVSTAVFGTERFRYDGKGRDLMKAYLKTVGLSFALLLVGFIALIALAPSLKVLGQHIAGLQGNGSLVFLFLPITLIVAGFALLGPLWIAYQGIRIKYHVTHTTLGPLRFQLEFRWQEYLRLTLGNLTLVVVTFGLALPLAAARSAKFFAQRLRCSGVLDYAVIAQNQQPLGRTGEGLFQVLDLGEL